MGYFWLNSNSKLRATLSPRFECRTKSCEQAEVGMTQGWERDVYLSGFMHADWWSEDATAVIPLSKQLQRQNTMIAIITSKEANHFWEPQNEVNIKKKNNKTLVSVFRSQMKLQELVCHMEPTSFPVPAFQWYPNTSSSFTVLLLSTSFSCSSWGK